MPVMNRLRHSFYDVVITDLEIRQTYIDVISSHFVLHILCRDMCWKLSCGDCRKILQMVY
jgi:hypothetical protein